MIVFIMILSFVFDFLFNAFFYNSLFLPLCVLVSLILFEPFYKNKRRYLFVCFLIGFLYDIVFTGDFFLSASLFLGIGSLVVVFNRLTPNNLFISFLEIVFFIFLYRLLCFLFFVVLGFVDFNFVILFNSIRSSLIFNLIYGVFLYFVLFFMSKKFNIRRIN